MRALSAIDGIDDICWTGSKFVVVGTSSDLPVVSSDGISWQTASGSFDARNVLSYNGHIVAGGYKPLFHSIDGINWDTVYVVHGIDTLWVRTFSHGLFADDSGFVTIAFDGTFLNLYRIRSTDGLTWSATLDAAATWIWRSIAVAPGNVVKIGRFRNIWHNGVIVDSTIGGLMDVVYSGAKFVAVGQFGSAISNDGITWVEHAGPELLQVVYTGSQFVARGWETIPNDTVPVASVYVSSDAITWTAKYRDFDDLGLGKMLYGADHVVIVLRNGTILTAP